MTLCVCVYVRNERCHVLSATVCEFDQRGEKHVFACADQPRTRGGKTKQYKEREGGGGGGRYETDVDDDVGGEQ